MLTRIVLFSIWLYQKTLSPNHGPLWVFFRFFGYGCYQEPTCSVYTVQMIKKYGLLRGLWKGLVRFWHCR